jgi:pilus assembly protein Flp/PilA
MKKLTAKLMAFICEEEGLTMVEYAVAGALITAAAAFAFTQLGADIADQIGQIDAVVASGTH